MNFYDYLENPQCDPVANLELVRARWLKAQHNLEEAKYLEKLIFNDYVRTIKNTKTAWDYHIPIIRKARLEIGKKKKKEKENLLYIERELKNTFFEDFDEEIKISEIIGGGFDCYYWAFTFMLNGVEYTIQVPARDVLNAENIKYNHEGKFVFIKRIDSCCTEVLFEAWTEKLLAEKIKEYFNDKS